MSRLLLRSAALCTALPRAAVEEASANPCLPTVLDAGAACSAVNGKTVAGATVKDATGFSLLDRSRRTARSPRRWHRRRRSMFVRCRSDQIYRMAFVLIDAERR